MASETVLEKPLPAADVAEDADTAADGGVDTAEQGPYQSHWEAVIGAFQDDPMLDVMMANIRQRRREMDADETIA